MLGARALASEIDSFSREASDISSNFAASSNILARFDQTDNFVLASRLANIIRGDSSNSVLIDSLHQDFDASGLDSAEILSILSNLRGNDGAEITANLYRALKFPYDSAVTGKRDLASAVNDLFQKDYIPSITSVMGDSDITPNAKYLNICSKENDVYTVGHSVFISYDFGFKGMALNQMQGLFTSSGRKSATAECAKHIIDYIGQDLYLTKYQPAGVTGSKLETGCSEALSPAVFMATCDAVFAHINID